MQIRNNEIIKKIGIKEDWVLRYNVENFNSGGNCYLDIIQYYNHKLKKLIEIGRETETTKYGFMVCGEDAIELSDNTLYIETVNNPIYFFADLEFNKLIKLVKEEMED